MKKLLMLFFIISTYLFANYDSAQSIIELRANILPLNFLIVEVDNVDFGDLNKGTTVKETTEINVYGRKELTVKVDVEETANLVNKNNNFEKLEVVMLNNKEITSNKYLLDQNIKGDEGSVSIPVYYELKIPPDVETGEYLGMQTVNVVIDI